MSWRRILFLAEGATMAHFVRLLALAEAVDHHDYEVFFFTPARFFRWLANQPFITGELRTMPGELFLARIAQGAPAFPADTLRTYIEDDRQLIGKIEPDLVIGDMRLSLSIAAREQAVPCAVLINAYWSPYTRRRSLLPELPLTRIVPPRFLGPLYRLSEPLAYRVHVGQMNRLRGEYGMAPLPPDLRALYTAGDYVLYPDIPEFVPASNLPAHHRYVGICDWAPPAARPGVWWERMMEDPRRKVFVSLGSSGPLRVLPALLKALSRLPVAVILATSGRNMPATGLAAYEGDLLPFTETARASAVVVSHGGSGGLYPAMAAGTPVLGIPGNADQHLFDRRARGKRRRAWSTRRRSVGKTAAARARSAALRSAVPAFGATLGGGLR